MSLRRVKPPRGAPGLSLCSGAARHTQVYRARRHRGLSGLSLLGYSTIVFAVAMTQIPPELWREVIVATISASFIDIFYPTLFIGVRGCMDVACEGCPSSDARAGCEARAGDMGQRRYHPVAWRACGCVGPGRGGHMSPRRALG